MPNPSQRSGLVAWLLLSLACLLVLVQAVSLYNRGKDLESDFGVFYRTCRLLDIGASGEIYTQRDSVTGWPISIPPAGLVLFQPFSHLTPAAAAAGWAMLNVLAAAFGAFLLRRLLEPSVFRWVATVFLVLSSASIQVGQYSVFFAVCWILATLAMVKGKESAFAWSWPAATKLYPTLMLAVPLSLSKSWKQAAKLVGLAVVSVVVFAYVLPFSFYGSRTIDLNSSFAQEVLFDTSGRVKWMQALGTTANQGLDSVLIRYLSWYPKFHEQYNVPTLALDLDLVRLLGHAVRAVIIAFTILAVIKWRRTKATLSPSDALLIAALWSATLYLCLPETRSRYAVYTVLAFIPLIQWCLGSKLRILVATMTFLLVLGVMPKPLEVAGFGIVGSTILWVVSVQSLRGARSF